MTDNVPEDEIDFGAERGLFWVQEGADRVGHEAKQVRTWKNVDFLRLKDFALHIVNPRPGLTVLDLGCANGSQMVQCGLQGAAVYGQDLNPKSVASANAKLRHFSITGLAKVGDVSELAFDDSSFDVVLSSDFHEHLDRPAQVATLSEVRRVLKPGGFLFVKTPNLNYLRLSRNFKRLRALSRFKSPQGFVIPHSPGTADPQHVGLSTRADLSSVLEESLFLNWEFFYAPLRRFRRVRSIELMSTEVPYLRDHLCEDLFCRAWKPIHSSHFPE